MLRLNIFFLILLFNAGIQAQDKPELVFKHISYKEGLAQSPISNFVQDDRGFIWFGNLKGLNRYDGYEFKTFIFDENDKRSLSNNRVNSIFQDSDGNLWVGTANGINLYNRDLETFTSIDILEIKGGQNYISSIIEDNQKNLWVGTFAGLRKLNRKTKRLENDFSKNAKGLNTSAIFSLFLDDRKNIWAGTKSGLKNFNPRTGELIPLPPAFGSIPNMETLKVLVSQQDDSGNYWFGTETSGLIKYERNLKSVTHYLSSEKNPNSLPSNWIKDILIFDPQTIWFATRNGISVFDTQTARFNNYNHDPANSSSLNDNAIWSFLKDRSSCVWVGTFAGGINLFYKGNSNFQNISENIGRKVSLNHILVNAISEDKDGSLWVGTFGGGLNHINRAKKTSAYYSIRSNDQKRPSNGIKSLADDGKGNLWVGTLDGLSIFNKQSKKFRHFNFPVTEGKLSENLINAILPERDGAWIGTNGGGLRYVYSDGRSIISLKHNTGQPFVVSPLQKAGGWNATGRMPYGYLNRRDQNAEKTISDNYVTALIKDKHGNLWVGTQNGLNYYDLKKKEFTALYKKVRDISYQINNSNITTLFIDSKQRLWIGTEGGGLNYFEKTTRRFYSISKNLGLGDDVVHSIVEDNRENLWISTDMGLYKLRFKSFKLPFKRSDMVISSYSANDGLISNQFSKNAGLKLKTNEIILGGINGLSIFYPDQIIKNNIKPKVALTQLLVNNREVRIAAEGSAIQKSISEAERIEVTHDQANLSFKYSALNFINPQNNQYAYKLEGLSVGTEWQNTGDQRVVNFANLPSGTYRFMIRAANNDGIWGTDIRSIGIVVLPPWWGTWWAYLLYFTILTIITKIIFRFLRNRTRLKQDLYLEHIDNERQKEVYRMKLDFFTNISHEIRTPLTLILGPLEKLLMNNVQGPRAEPLKLIKNNADRLMKLVTELLDFRKAEEGHLKLNCSEQDISLFCEEIFDSFKGMAEAKNIRYEFLRPEEPMFVYFDGRQLEKVLFNLLSNAFKFTNDQGKITLSISLRPESHHWVDIKVSDNGRGIPANLQDKLFESFFQVEDHGRINIGSGIGLALSKSIIELHHGTIEVFSNSSVGASTVFTVSLRTGKGHLSSALIKSETAIIEHITEPPEFLIEEDRVGMSDVIPASRKAFRILIADDNIEVRKLIAGIFDEEYHVFEFDNGQDAVDFMEEEIPDLIISDIMMPVMDGLTFCKVVKTSESTNHIPFILLTAKASIGHQTDGLSVGADVYISKPFSPQILALNVRNLLKAQSLMREKFGQLFSVKRPDLHLTTPEDKFIKKLMEIIQAKMGDPDFDVNELVNNIGMSRTVLYRKVQTLTNYSVADLIKQLRLKRAAELLQVSTLPVAEVAYTVGFNDRKHFSKEFKKQYQVSPSEYIQSFQ